MKSVRLVKSSFLAILGAGLLYLSLQVPTKAQNFQNHLCDRSVVVNVSTATTTSLINNIGVADNPTKLTVCEINLTVVGTATANQITFEYGTGATCGTGTVAVSGPFTADASAGVMKVLALHMPFATIPVAQRFCVLTSQAAVVAGTITYSLDY